VQTFNTWKRRLAWGLILLLSLCVPTHVLATAGAEGPGKLFLPADASFDIADLVKDALTPSSKYVFANPEIDGTTVRLRLIQKGTATPSGALVLRPLALHPTATIRSRSFAINKELTTPFGSAEYVQPRVDGRLKVHAQLDQGAESIVRRDQGGFYRSPPAEIRVQDDEVPSVPEEPLYPFFWVVLSMAALLGVAIVAMRTWVGSVRVGLKMKITHILPSTLQLTIFAYWSAYWSGVSGLILSIAIQLLYAILLEAALGLFLRRKWEVGLGVFPIVLSTNLFVQFPLEDTFITLTMLTLALVSKVLIQSNGKHIFNPSAFGVGVVGLVNVLWPEMGQGDHSWNFGAAPNMTEVVLLVAIIVQLRLPIVLISISAFLGLTLLTLWDLGTVRPTWAPMFLVITLLVTDPSTIPKTPWGKVLFGFTFGVSSGLLGVWMKGVWGNDFYSKILMVLPVNAARGLFDRVGDSLSSWRWMPSSALAPRFNRAHMVVWWTLVAGTLFSHSKEEVFLAMDPGGRPFVVYQDDGSVVCQDNPLYCRPFSLEHEWRVWTQ
jgi:hypothetical protein